MGLQGNRTENPDAVRVAVRARGINLDLDELLSLDQASRVWLALYEGCQSSITNRGPCQASSRTAQGCPCPGCPCPVDRLSSVFCFSTNVKIAFACEEFTKRMTNIPVVVDDYDTPDHGFASLQRSKKSNRRKGDDVCALNFQYDSNLVNLVRSALILQTVLQDRRTQTLSFAQSETCDVGLRHTRYY